MTQLTTTCHLYFYHNIIGDELLVGITDNYLLDLLKTDDIDLETRKPTITKRFWTYIRSKRQDNVGVTPLVINDDVVSDSREKANLLSNYFKSVFTKEDLQNMPPEATSPYADIPPIHFSTAGITKLLQKVNCKKAYGPDGIPYYILKEAAAELAPFLQFLFTQSLHTGSVPQTWLKATVVPVHKKGSRSLVDLMYSNNTCRRPPGILCNCLMKLMITPTPGIY